jgi:hypothetical protein
MSREQFNRGLLFLVAAILCFAIALLIATGVVDSTNGHDWEVGGFLALALSFLP